MKSSFEVQKQWIDASGVKRARAGLFKIPSFDGKAEHSILTPVFMPVGTAGTVKGILPRELTEMQAQIILGNTYHLYLRPGHELVERMGGLHRFMGWSGPILTDSGGFQVFSLSGLNQIDEDGVTFQSHWDGSSHRFTAEKSMEIQRALGSNIVMAFDQCPSYPCSFEMAEQALDRTVRWAKRGLQVPLQDHQLRFGIVQGGLFEGLRKTAVQAMTSLNFDGFAIGGLSIGESPEMMQAMTRWTAPLLPENRPRYLMGVGRPQDLVEGVRAGIDLFDCVMPTRNARNGQLFTSRGKVNIKNARYRDLKEPLDPECPCEACTQFTCSYLRHLFINRELLSARLNTIHNLTYYIGLMYQMRMAILEERWEAWVQSFYASQGIV